MKTAGHVFVILTFLWLAPAAHGCVCMEYETPTCAEYWRSEFVFVARVKSILPKAAKFYLGGSSIFDDNSVARLQIEEVMRGDISGEVLSLVGQGSDCLVEYQRGNRYLVFAHSLKHTTRMIGTSICSGTVKVRGRDSGFLNLVRSFSKQSAVSILGRVMNHNEMPMPRLQVTAESNGRTYVTVTDEKGDYRFPSLQQGPFAVRIEVPFKAFDSGYIDSREVVLTPGKSVLEYSGTAQKGECIYKQFIVVKYAKP